MHILADEQIVQSKLLASVHGLTHGFTTRGYGDMRKDKTARKQVIDRHFLKKTTLYVGEQVHSQNISIINRLSITSVPGVDGLVTTASCHMALGVFVADCVPILLVDPVAGMVATIHAGWRGTQKNICQEIVRNLESLGSNTRYMKVWIGPHIGVCSYSVDNKRAKVFLDLFGKQSNVVVTNKNDYFIDLGLANFLQLVDAGIPVNHIEVSTECTFCQNDKFFSYRKDSKDTFGHMMGFIGFNTP